MDFLFNVDKVSEGGMGQKHAIRLLKEAGFLNVTAFPSIYVGQSGVMVCHITRREMRKIEKILWG